MYLSWDVLLYLSEYIYEYIDYINLMRVSRELYYNYRMNSRQVKLKCVNLIKGSKLFSNNIQISIKKDCYACSKLYMGNINLLSYIEYSILPRGDNINIYIIYDKIPLDLKLIYDFIDNTRPSNNCPSNKINITQKRQSRYNIYDDSFMSNKRQKKQQIRKSRIFLREKNKSNNMF